MKATYLWRVVSLCKFIFTLHEQEGKQAAAWKVGNQPDALFFNNQTI